MNTATQTLTATNNIQRWAVCPLHEKRSSEFLGVGEGQSGKVSWRFRCTANTIKGQRADHIFSALPDRHAPKTAEETTAWMVEQKMRRAGLALTRSQS